MCQTARRPAMTSKRNGAGAVCASTMTPRPMLTRIHMRTAVDQRNLLARVRNPPDRLRSIVSDEQRPVGADGDADRSAPDLAIGCDESREEVLELPCRFALFERHADHVVAGTARAIPRSMLRRKRIAAKFLGKLASVVKGHAERRV